MSSVRPVAIPIARTEAPAYPLAQIKQPRFQGRGHSVYAMLQKIYGAPSDEEQRRYSPAKCIGCDMKAIIGKPDPAHVSTSYVERQNLTMRMQMRRFTRLTNGFSKKVDNHRHAVALHYMHYNFCRIHQTLRVTPAMEAGITDHPWGVEDLVALLPKPTVGPFRVDKELFRRVLGEIA